VANGQAMSRRGEFDDGSHGGDETGAGMHPATSIQQGVPAEFSPDSILQIPNVIKSMNGMSEGTYSKSLPMQAMMRSTTGYGGNGTMNV
jgi:hypothetical protein